MREPHALVVEPAGNLWGSERALLDLLGWVVTSPWQVAVCCPPRTPIVERLAKLPVKVYPTFVAGLHRKSRLHRLWAAVGLLAAAIHHRPHLLHVNQAGTTRIALAVGRILRIPVIAHVRLAEDVAYVESLGASAGELPLVVCISQYIRGLFQDRAQANRTGLVVLYDPYLPQLGWEDAPRHVNPGTEFACVGRLTPVKGQDIVLKAIDHLKRAGTLAQVHFFGTGEPGDSYSLELAELVLEMGISEQVFWRGYQEEIPSCIAPMAALLCPSHSEPLGRVIFEAWDAGTIPVAWSGSGGPAEVIQASEAGFLYAEQTGKSLARALQRALDLTPSNRQQMVAQGRQWLLSNCNPAVSGQRLLDLWREAARLP